MTKLGKGRRANASTQKSLIAQKIMSDMSTVYPSMYTSSLKDIINEIMNDNDSTGILFVIILIIKKKMLMQSLKSS
jgi:hypothetical protein